MHPLTHDDAVDPDSTAVTQRPDVDAVIAPAIRTLRPYLVVANGAGAEVKRFRIRQEMVIGRAPHAGLQLKEEGVSRQHAKLVLTPEGTVKLVDLGSRNGTYVNGLRVLRRTLEEGDSVRIGSRTVLRLSYEDGSDDGRPRPDDSSSCDPMTKLANKKTLGDALVRELSFASRHDRPLSLALFDVDHFDFINETHGAQAGDHVLKVLARVVSEALRAEDLFARVAGEEFAIVLRDLPAPHALACAERIRAKVEETQLVFDERPIHVTISVGVATIPAMESAASEQLVAAADRALYDAKRSGMNRVHMTIPSATETQRRVPAEEPEEGKGPSSAGG